MVTEQQLLSSPVDDYMNETQLEFFYHRLRQMRQEIQLHADDALEKLHQLEQAADESDRASQEEEMSLYLRMLDRERRLLPKIDEALQRIRDGSYGYCEVTGEPIGLRRLLARPTTTLCIEEKERQERLEKHVRV